MADGQISQAIAAVATLCDKDAQALYERLFKWAIRLKCDPDLAQDMASEALCVSLQEGCPQWHFASAKAYDEAARTHHGSKAKLNFPQAA